MSSPKYRWWSFVRRMIRDYPALTRSRSLSQDDQRDYAAVSAAMEITRLMPNGDAHLDLIHRVYWAQEPQTLEGAAVRFHISEQTAKNWHGDFVRLVAKCWGFTCE